MYRSDSYAHFLFEISMNLFLSISVPQYKSLFFLSVSSATYGHTECRQWIILSHTPLPLLLFEAVEKFQIQHVKESCRTKTKSHTGLVQAPRQLKLFTSSLVIKVSTQCPECSESQRCSCFKVLLLCCCLFWGKGGYHLVPLLQENKFSPLVYSDASWLLVSF